MENVSQTQNVVATKYDVFKPKKKRNWERIKRFFGLAALILTFTLSIVTTYTMWCTDFYQQELLRIVTLKEGGILYNLWENPPVPNNIYVYIFNYTNPQEALSGAEKPKLQELGPYVYREFLQRVHVVVNENGTLTYQEKRTIEYLPELSKGDLNDTVIVPNIPLMTAMAGKKATVMGWVTHMTVKVLMAGFNARPFLTIRANDFVWDYGDAFTTASTTLASIVRKPAPKKLGILADREGLSPVVRTIWSGVGHLDKVNMIDKINGMTRLGIWESEECDSIESTDGCLFGAQNLSPDSQLYIYIHDFCRRVPFVYDNSSTMDGYPTHRFAYSPTAFASANVNPVNACFCNGSHCPPSGVSSISKCAFDAPLYVSYPHFLYGDSSLLEGVEGLNPDPAKHAGYMNIHTTLGLPISGRSRFQLGIQVHHTGAVPTYKGIANGTILPLFWLDFEVGEMTEDVHNVLYHFTFTSYYGKVALTWGSPVVFLISVILIVLMLRKKNK